MDEHLYYYRAEVQSVYDGDTCTLNIDLGLGTWAHHEKIRLARSGSRMRPEKPLM